MQIPQQPGVAHPAPKANQPKKKVRGAALRALTLCSEMGISVAACLFVGVFLGKYLDRLLGTSPWLLLLLSLLGMIAAFRTMFALAKRGFK